MCPRCRWGWFVGAIISAIVAACQPHPVPTSRTLWPVSSWRASFIMETICGADAVCPQPIGKGASTA